jgi:hypothetical protein
LDKEATMGRTINSGYEMVPHGSVRPHPRNPRRGDIGAVKESVDVNGFFGALVVQRSTGYILAGNHRWRAAGEVGMDQIPVIWVDVDDATATRVLLADNRTSDLGTYDDAALAALVQSVASDAGTLLGTGYTDADLDELLAALTPPGEDEWADAFGALPEGDKEPFRQMTFTVHDSQHEVIERALADAKSREDFTGSPNENSNGNALTALASAYLRGAR